MFQDERVGAHMDGVWNLWERRRGGKVTRGDDIFHIHVYDEKMEREQQNFHGPREHLWLVVRLVLVMIVHS